MNKILLALVCAAALLAGCNENDPPKKGISYEVTNRYDMPAGLSGCTVYLVEGNSFATNLSVMRCPNSTTSTTYASGKTHKTVIVVDGIEYEATKKETK